MAEWSKVLPVSVRGSGGYRSTTSAFSPNIEGLP